MNHTEINSKFLGMSEDNDLEYYIRLPEWAEFFNGQEAFKLVIVNDDMFVNHNKYLASYHDKYKSIYNHLECHQNDILKVLETYCLNEYNYYRKYRLTSCLKSYLEEQMKLTPVIENRADAARFFQLLNIQILPFKKEEEHYILFNIELIQAKKHDNSNESFSIMILGNDFKVSIHSGYTLESLKQITMDDKNGIELNDITNMHMDYNSYVLHTKPDYELTDFSVLRFRGRSIMTKYKELIPYTSCLELLECDDRNCDCGLPPASKIIGRIGVDGIFFFIVKRTGQKKDEAPIYVVSPMNFDCYIAPVARNLTEFISLGIACKNFGILETVSVYSKEDFEYCLSKKESNPSIEEIIRIIKLNFPVISIKNPYDYIKKIQNEPEFKEESNYLNSYILKKLGLNE